MIVRTMVKKWFLFLAIILLVSSLHFSSFEVEAAPAIGSTTVTLYSIADAYVNSSSSETNYGSADYLYVSASSEQDFTYVMFDLSSLPPDANIISAELKIYLSSTGGDIYGIPADKIGTYYCSDNSWTELGITWNNRPSFNAEPTDTWSFSIIYYVMRYKSWDITEDVQIALPLGNLTEVLKFSTKTGDGYAVFHSRERANMPKLEIEYSTEPVFVVHLESAQDTGATSNFGFTTFADYPFSLPIDIDVVNGTYTVTYSSGYMFVRWETTGGVTVADENVDSTVVSVLGNGTLRAVGSNKKFQYAYDNGNPQWCSEEAGHIDAVKFTPLFSGQLLTACYYIYDVSSYLSNTFRVHAMDNNRNDLITPFNVTPTSEGWFDVDLSSYGISVTEGVNFYIGMEWTSDYNPALGEDITNPSERSWYWNGTHWDEETYSDFMIRAVVGTLIDHAVVADGFVFNVPTESNSTISNFQFIKGEKKIIFNVTGTTSTHGFCNITIPNQLLGGPFNVTFGEPFDGQSLSEVLSLNNGTHTWLYFTYIQSSHRIEITGTTVIPEVPSILLPILFMVTTLIASIFRKKFRMTKKQTKTRLSQKEV
jgi:hypothetical protein